MFLKALQPTLIFSAIAMILHVGLNYLLKSLVTTDIVLIHVILFALTLGGYLLILMMENIDANKVGFTFLAVSTIKLLVSVSVILIMFKMFNKPKSIGVHFAGAYFIYIGFLSFKTFALINKPK